MVTDCVSAPIGMVSLPAMKTVNYHRRSHNPGCAAPINVVASDDADIFGPVPHIIVRRVCHVPGWRWNRCWSWRRLHRYRRWRRIAPRGPEERCHDKKPAQYCFFHLISSFTYQYKIASSHQSVNQTGPGENNLGKTTDKFPLVVANNPSCLFSAKGSVPGAVGVQLSPHAGLFVMSYLQSTVKLSTDAVATPIGVDRDVRVFVHQVEVHYGSRPNPPSGECTPFAPTRARRKLVIND